MFPVLPNVSRPSLRNKQVKNWNYGLIFGELRNQYWPSTCKQSIKLWKLSIVGTRGCGSGFATAWCSYTGIILCVESKLLMNIPDRNRRSELTAYRLVLNREVTRLWWMASVRTGLEPSLLWLQRLSKCARRLKGWAGHEVRLRCAASVSSKGIVLSCLHTGNGWCRELHAGWLCLLILHARHLWCLELHAGHHGLLHHTGELGLLLLLIRIGKRLLLIRIVWHSSKLRIHLVASDGMREWKIGGACDLPGHLLLLVWITCSIHVHLLRESIGAFDDGERD